MDAEKRVELEFKLRKAEDEIKALDAITADWTLEDRAYSATVRRRTVLLTRYCRMLRNLLNVEQMDLF